MTRSTTDFTAANITANDLTWGVEIETHMNAVQAPAVHRRLSWKHGKPVAWLPIGWEAMTDSTIKALDSRGNTILPEAVGRVGREFVSPILKGEEGLLSVRRACNELKERGARINKSCGVHITVSFPSNDGAALARLLCLVANHEAALFGSTGTPTRETGGWCKTVKDYGNDANASDRARNDRYHAVNLTHIARGNDRIEFRLFSASLNGDKIAAWVQMVLGLVEIALNSQRKTTWEFNNNGKRNPWNKLANTAGNAEKEMVRLFYRLGWTKGHAKQTYGIVDSAPNARNDAKATLIRLARKYDESRSA